jgi:NTE family protein
MLAAWLLLPVLCSACSTAHYAINEPKTNTQATGYTLRNLPGKNNSDGLMVVLALSGGGYRAAALAHAVMSRLSETPIRWEGAHRSLLDEVDAISAVSGGSLAAAYFALRPREFVQEFEQRVLSVDLQAALVSRALSPTGLWRQTSSTFGRGDLLQEVLDEKIFEGKLFAQIPRQRPMVYINATDMRHGQRFEFTQDQFDHLCSNLDAFPVSRAVAASMAVPVLLSPITVWNQRERCTAPAAPRPMLGAAADTRYVHLVDGGLADNTGLNAVLETVSIDGGLRYTPPPTFQPGTARKRVIIVVNAQVSPPDPAEDSPTTPSLVRQMRSLVNVPIDRHADAKVQHLSDTVRQWQAELQATTGPGGRQAGSSFHVIELNMSRARNPARAETLQGIPSGLRIEPEQVAQIRAFVDEELAGNRQWQALLKDLGDRDLQAIAP